MTERLRLLGRRLLHGPAFTRALERCGVDVPRFRLLADLFETLGARQEVVGFGDEYSMRGLMNIWFGVSAVVSVLAAVVGAAPGVYLALFLGLTVFQLGVLLLPEIAESLVNPVDGQILAHQPVNGATWSAAKLAHLTRMVVRTVTGLNAVPALVGLALPHDGIQRFVHPPLHYLVALGVAMVFALLCCSLFGWLVRIVPVRRLKAAAAMAQALPMLALFGFNVGNREIAEWAAAPRSAVFEVTGGLAAAGAAGGAVVAAVAVVFGLRAFSRDHLIRVAGLMSAGRGRRRTARRWIPGRGTAKAAGGQAGRAGFEFVRTMMVRDWQFLREMAMSLVAPVVGFIALLVVGRDVSPFGPDFAWAHVLPHLFGYALLSVCVFLAYGNDHKGAWCFAVVPDSAFGPFARGIHAALWFLLVVVPHAGWLLVLAWSWGAQDALLFVAFSAAAASLHLGAALRLIDGVPFGRQAQPTRRFALMGVYLLSTVVTAVAVGIQYWLFRSVAAVALVTIATALGAYFVTRLTLAGLAARMAAGLRPATPGSLFRALGNDAA